ncbi:MAG: hypothetical protein AAF670_18180 [Planctomycetota bacterium]
MNPTKLGCWVVTIGLATFLVGCGDRLGAVTATSREQLTRSKPPAECDSLTDAAAAIKGSDAPQSVQVVGRIAGSDMAPFDPDQSIFMLSEAPAADHDTDDPDHADNCPFCRRRAEKAPTAMVTLVDPDTNEPYPQDATTLVGLRIGDRVSFVGEATFNADLNLLNIRTGQVHIAR